MSYQNFILTLIAACLLVIAARGVQLFPEVKASTASPYGLLSINEDGSLNVRLVDQQLDVSITDIETRDNLNVNIEEIGGGWIRSRGPLPVTIED